jgi:activator of HSP90 ATPase
MDSRKHSRFTGMKAKFACNAGGAFSTYGTSLPGFALELDPNKRIVQAWSVDDWLAGEYSIAAFTFAPVKRGTGLTFTQFGMHNRHYRGINQRGKDYY